MLLAVCKRKSGATPNGRHFGYYKCMHLDLAFAQEEGCNLTRVNKMTKASTVLQFESEKKKCIEHRQMVGISPRYKEAGVRASPL
jgi:hypothetical protein